MIWRGSYGARTGARRAMTSSARTMKPPMAPRGFRVENLATAITGAASARQSTRMSGMALPAVLSLATIIFSPCGIASLVVDPGIEHAVQQVNHQVQDQDDRGNEQDDGLQHDEIPVHDTIDQQGSHARHHENGLDDDHATQEPAELIP